MISGRRQVLAALAAMAPGCPPAEWEAQALRRPHGDPVAALPRSGNSRGEYLHRHRFFSNRSPWNTEIHRNAELIAAPGVESLQGGISAWTPEWSNVAIFFARPSDPLTPVRFIPDTWSPVRHREWLRSGNSPAVEGAIRHLAESRLRYPGNLYSTQTAGRAWNAGGLPPAFRRAETNAPVMARIPRGAEPAPDSDGNTVVVQPDGRALELYSPIKLSSGEWVSEMYSFTDAFEGAGTGWENGRRASMIPCYAGVVRDIDIARGRIDHALALIATAAVLKPAFIPPAIAFDSDSSMYRGELPMGTRLALPRSRDAPAAVQTALGRMLAAAARDYGMIFVDSGGGGLTIATELSPAMMAAAKREPGLAADITAIVRSCKAVLPHCSLRG